MADDFDVQPYLGLVHQQARYYQRRTSRRVPYDDLVSAGNWGLWEAARRFDIGTGFAFSTFAVPRIRGAILDELRRVFGRHGPHQRPEFVSDEATHRRHPDHRPGGSPTD